MDITEEDILVFQSEAAKGRLKVLIKVCFQSHITLLIYYNEQENVLLVSPYIFMKQK